MVGTSTDPPTMTPLKLFSESVVVGILVAIATGVAHGADMAARKEKAMTHTALALQAFVGGAGLHAALEVAGLNKWYCDARTK